MLRVATIATVAATAQRSACVSRSARMRSTYELPLACAQRWMHMRCALFSTSDTAASLDDDEDRYLELLQLRDIKSEEFYDAHALERRYFYYIDLQGRLFLENTRPKNIATSLKSAKFLKFFFSQLRPNDDDAPSSSQSLVQFAEYPFRSPCGKEMNFVKCADRPFVFEDFRECRNGAYEFAYGGGELTAPFSPEQLKISLSTGRLYHDVPVKYASASNGRHRTGRSRDTIAVALIKSQLAVEFGRDIDLFDAPVAADDGAGSDCDGTQFVGEFAWRGQRYPIRAIE